MTLRDKLARAIHHTHVSAMSDQVHAPYDQLLSSFQCHWLDVADAVLAVLAAEEVSEEAVEAYKVAHLVELNRNSTGCIATYPVEKGLAARLRQYLPKPTEPDGAKTKGET